MRRKLVLWLLLVTAGSGALAAQVLPVSYEIEVSLSPSDHRLEAEQHMRWTNTTTVRATELAFHLYLNAFASSDSSFMRELGQGSLRRIFRPELDWGWIRITTLTTGDGVDLLPGLSFSRPDDGNEHDFTVAVVALPEPVEPGQSLDLELDFEARLPRVIARTGYAGDFHLVGQWYPKLGVFEEVTEGGETVGRWNCHQFHANTEFFADFASYRVQVELPEDWVVGATGVELWRDLVPGGETARRRVEFRAERVHDFAWCAAPGALMEVVEAEFNPANDVPASWLEKARARLGLSAAELELPPLHLRLMVPRTQSMLSERMLHAARLAIAWYGLHYGPYPFPQLTVVSPPPGADEAGGMEYPTFITTGASRLMATPLASWTPFLETVTVHEFGHQYFQGLLASNEFEEAWLDEGFTSFAETQCMSDIVADGLVPEMAGLDFWAAKRLELAAVPDPVRVDRPAWQFRRRLDYFRASYDKTALVLKTLEGLLGEEALARALRRYVEEHRFTHPTGDDVLATLERATGHDLGWFFAQAVRGDAVADWGVLAVRQKHAAPPEGLRFSGGAWEPIGEEAPGESWLVEVEVGRIGDFVGPVEVELIFADGGVERRRWDSSERWRRFELQHPSRLERVVVDPDGVWVIEGRRRDNYWRDEAAPARPSSSSRWVQVAAQLVALLGAPWI